MSDAPVAFFSYSREDSEFALRLASDLRAAGSSVWIDQLDIGPGQLWDRAVQTALERCPSVLIILSPASVNSDNVMDEVSFALDQKKELIPVLYRDCDIPFRVRRFQHLDFRSNYEPMLQELKKCLHIAGKSAAASAMASTASSAAHAAEMYETAAPVVQSPQIPYPAPPVEQRQAPVYQPRPASPAEAGARTRSKFPKWAKIAIAAVAGLILIIVLTNVLSNSGQQSAEPAQRQNAASDDSAASAQPTEPASNGAAELTGAALSLREAVRKCDAPKKTQTDFSVEDAAVELDFGFRNASPTDDWTIDWISPDGRTYDSQDVENTDTGHGMYCYYIYVAGHRPAEMPGAWAVSLNRNGEEMARLPFRITR